MNQPVQQIRVIFRGTVQGVGFRAVCRSLAQNLGLTGLIRNRDDGTVEMEVQGTEDRIERLLELIDEEFGPNYIKGIEKSTQPLIKKMEGFNIVR